MYAGIAHRLGWLDRDRTLSDNEFQRRVGPVGLDMLAMTVAGCLVLDVQRLLTGNLLRQFLR
jgi:hypothetical protein